ncbi:alpha-amylase family protein [Alteromonas sp. ASW11-19]|uniref:Alpha-amylase n=1 Tax=Alteromonas salexigens TaxID=2982530 RepID=A0ABT2VKW8_9ALTE|nr:alpha-amylase family protein [Alteromonas salexigens]MCU7553674.1 alpha-amylase family protein [Alteromonas salexigens]
MKATLTSTALASALMLAPSAAHAAPTTFVHLFDWNWQDIATECETFLGPKGYAAIQVSPPNEHIDVSQWWARYQPVSYVLQSRGGNRAEFIDMVQRCDAAGVDIYVDAVINHMAAGSGTGTAGNTFGNKSYPNYSPQDFHDTCAINDYGNRWEVQNCELVGLADLDTDASYVQSTLAGYLNDLVNIGVAGFRLDASKHMPAADIAGVLQQVNGNPLVFQEVIDQGGEAVSASEYFGNGLVTEFKYSVEIGNVFRNGSLSWLSNFGEAWGFMPSHQAVVFVDNHDNQRAHGGGGNVITFEDGRLYDLANVFMLAWPYGYPKVMSSFDFHGDTDAGPPAMPVHNNGNLECFGSNWKCEHRWSYIAGGVDFRNNTADNFSVTDWWSNGGNQIAFGRADSGFVVINKESYALTASLQTSMAPGEYCDVLTGQLNAAGNGCTGTTVTVDSSGMLAASVASWEAIAIHKGARVSGQTGSADWQRTVIFIEAETTSGQDMFVRGGIDHDYAASALGRNCTSSNYACAIPIVHNNLKNTTTAPWKANDNYLDWYGIEASQSSEAEGSALDWTTNSWPAEWGAVKTVANDGYGETPLNTWGQHYWMLDVQMDCSKTVNGWFELKAFVKNGQGWEGDIAQSGTPYSSTNHMAQCGKKNMFRFGQNTATITNL